MKHRSTPQMSDLFPAQKIIQLFGGPARLHLALKTQNAKAPNRSTIYRWRYPPPKGLGGWIPRKYWKQIIEAGVFEGVFLSEKDFMLPYETHALRRGSQTANLEAMNELLNASECEAMNELLKTS